MSGSPPHPQRMGTGAGISTAFQGWEKSTTSAGPGALNACRNRSREACEQFLHDRVPAIEDGVMQRRGVVLRHSRVEKFRVLIENALQPLQLTTATGGASLSLRSE